MLLPLLPLLLSHREGLQTQVSFRERYLPVSDFARKMSDLVKEPVTVQPLVADRKVAIFCKDVPFQTILDRVRTTLFLQVTHSAKGYKIELDPKVATEELQQLAIEANAVREATRQQIAWIQSIGRLPYEQAKDVIAHLKAEHVKLAHEDVAQVSPEHEESDVKTSFFNQINTKPAFYEMGHVLSRMTPLQVESLLDGEPQFASTESIPGMFLLPGAILRDKSISSMESKSVLVSIVPDNVSGAVRFNLTFEHSTGSISTGTSLGGSSSRSVIRVLANTPLSKRLQTWGVPSDAAVLGMPLRQEAKLVEPGPDNALTFADQLQYLHDKTGVPIVAMSLRQFGAFPRPSPGATIKQWLASFADPVNQRNAEPYRIRSETGWLMGQPRSYWRTVRQDLPERLIDKMMTRKVLGFKEYAWLTTQLTPDMEAGIDARQWVLPFPIGPTGNHLLVWWWSLAPGAKRLCQTAGYPFRDVPADVKQSWFKLIRNRGKYTTEIEAIRMAVGRFNDVPWNELVIKARLSPGDFALQYMEPPRFFDPLTMPTRVDTWEPFDALELILQWGERNLVDNTITLGPTAQRARLAQSARN